MIIPTRVNSEPFSTYISWVCLKYPVEGGAIRLAIHQRDEKITLLEGAAEADEKLDLPDEWRVKLDHQTRIALKDFDTFQVSWFSLTIHNDDRNVSDSRPDENQRANRSWS